MQGEAASHLERDDGPHAVAEECEWLGYPQGQRLVDLVGQYPDVFDHRLAAPILSAWILHAQHLDVRPEQRLEPVEVSGRAPGERETHQPDLTVRNGLQPPDPQVAVHALSGHLRSSCSTRT